MLGLKLRPEFLDSRLKGTAIELTNDKKTGATEIPAEKFLEISYPTADLLKALEAISPSQERPLVLIGERGQGKSHILGVLHHAATSPDETRKWLKAWAKRLGNSKLAELDLRPKTLVISESLHRQNYKFLWDLLFDRHPHGERIRGRWEASGEKKTEVPGEAFLLELFKHTPTVLILDEFQTWYDGLIETKQRPNRSWAFNFIQTLSEIAKSHPELLALVVSVRSGATDAYQQIHRVNPSQVDFKGPTARKDRLNLLLHRLFENRMQIAESDIQGAIQIHVDESIRLAEVGASEQGKLTTSYLEAWPFAPSLMTLLEDQVLVATTAQETRDLIKILVNVFKSLEKSPKTTVITAADFRIDLEKSPVGALLDSIANQKMAELRTLAQRNLQAAQEANPEHVTALPQLVPILSALWLRSLSVAEPGADAHQLQIDVTRESKLNDNSFAIQLQEIVENSFNIHEVKGRYVFRAEENRLARLTSTAKNDKVFKDDRDRVLLAKELRVVLGGVDTKAYRVVVLPHDWDHDPWAQVIDPADVPEKWDQRIPLLVVPSVDSASLQSQLGTWLAEKLPIRRNAVRFLLPVDGSTPLYLDKGLRLLARKVLLAEDWSADDYEYRKLHDRVEKELRDHLKNRFDRFAILSTWDYQQPANCRFSIEAHQEEGGQIPEAVDAAIRKNLFVQEDFAEFILKAAAANRSLGDVIRELQEPRPNGEDCIAWLGEITMTEKVFRLCAEGKIAIHLRSHDLLQRQAGETFDAAWARLKSKPPTGKQLDETTIQLPGAILSDPPVPPLPPVPPGGPSNGPGTPPPPGGGTTSPPGGVTTPPGPGPTPTGTHFHGDPTSAINHYAKAKDVWKIGPNDQLLNLVVRTSALTGAQLLKLLKALAEVSTKYEIDVDKP